jgi:hypothetical protein
MKKSIFEFADKFGVESPFGDWEREQDLAKKEYYAAVAEWYSDRECKNRVSESKIGVKVYCKLIAVSANLFGKSVRIDFLYGTNKRAPSHMSSMKDGKKVLSKTIAFGPSKEVVFELEIPLSWKDLPNGLHIWCRVEEQGFLYMPLIVEFDPYIEAIHKGDILYSCNCGWIDTKHAFTQSIRGLFNIGLDNLWKQVLFETPIKSVWKDGYKVTYTQDAKIGPLYPGTTRSYFVKSGLPVDVKERIALSILMEVSYAFESYQQYGALIGKGDSAFEPADLVSNLLGLYSRMRPELTKEVILEKCKSLNASQSKSVYLSYPNTFSSKEYKNYEFHPRFFRNEFCGQSKFPKEFQEIIPFEKDNENFRDWIDLLDVHNGKPPITGPKY